MALAALEATRREWGDGHRRLEAASSDRPRYRVLLFEVELILDQLRRRIGQTFTLEDLANAYREADRWVQETLAEREQEAGWPARMTIVQDAAFHLYSRGAVDYRP
jgi:cobyrinic acid a,c-diamide synthase